MNIDQPNFRFNPGAYGDGRSFERSNDACDICHKPSVWKYSGSLYAAANPSVCARCIANGDLAKFLNDEHFSFHDIELDGANASLEIELLQRTPGVSCFNPFEWPVLNATPMVFIGYGEDAPILSDDGAQEAIETAFKELDWEFEPGEPTPYALVFKEIDGTRYRAVIDLD